MFEIDENGGKTWPAGFLRYVADKKKKAIPKAFERTKKIKDLPLDIKKNHLFGCHVSGIYKEAKKVINNQLNPLWIPPSQLKSGNYISRIDNKYNN